MCENQPQRPPQEPLARKFRARGRARFFRPRQMGHAAKVDFDLEVRFPALFSPGCRETSTRRRSWLYARGTAVCGHLWQRVLRNFSESAILEGRQARAVSRRGLLASRARPSAPCLPVHREAMGRSTCIRPLALNAERCRKKGKANLQHVGRSQFHVLASACAVLRSHAQIVGVVEKSDFSARARARAEPLDTVFRDIGDFCLLGTSAQRRGPGKRI